MSRMRQTAPAARATRLARLGDSPRYQHTPRPIAPMAVDHPTQGETPWHSHPRAQLLFAAEGVMTVATRNESWIVPPQRAAWMPSRIEHRLAFAGGIRFRTLYVEQDAVPGMPKKPVVLDVTPLLRELILRVMDLPLDYDEHGAEGRLAGVLLDELQKLAEFPIGLPIPAKGPLSIVCRGVLDRLGERSTLEDLATRHHTSARTLARRFRRDTGLSFAEWCRRARLVHAITWISEGRPVTSVALDLGYDSPSAFCAMFKRELGVPPTRFKPAAAA
jgi:AraC-like DNA-binding protein/quercetin dioxygenase-like cupin family protein